MRKQLCVLILLILGGAFSARSQDVPKWEVSAGYSYVRANLITPSGCCFSLNGGAGSLTWNAKDWLGLEGEIGGYHAGNIQGSGKDLTLVSFMGGPHLAYRKSERLTPFAHVLFGGGHAGGTLYTGTSTSPGLGTNNNFNMVAGGGLDLNLGPHIAVRVFQADYFLTHFLNGTNDRQNNLRLTFGLVLHFGSR